MLLGQSPYFGQIWTIDNDFILLKLKALVLCIRLDTLSWLVSSATQSQQALSLLSILSAWCIQNQEEWLIHRKTVLPFSQTGAGWRAGQRGSWWSSARASAVSCTWEGTTPCSSTGPGLTCWRAALRRGTWVSWRMTSLPWASSVP